MGYQKASGSSVRVGEFKLGSRQWTIGRRAFRISDQLDPGGLVVVRIGYGGRISDIRTPNGARLTSVALEPEVIRSVHGEAYEDRIPVGLENISKHLIDAVLAIEDQRFFGHDGLDPRRVVGATLANVRARRIVQGASTITQQLAKNLFLSPRRSVTRKLREIAMARTLELRYDKREILEAYLNEVYLGQEGALAIHGVGRASQFFFGKDVSQLSVVESALLAGIIRGPSLYSPFRNPAAAKARRDLVLDRMLALGLMTEEKNRQARESPLGLRSKTLRARSGRYFVDFVANQLRTEVFKVGNQRGLSVFTTLDMELQLAAESAVRDGLAELERYYPRLASDSAPLQAALVALDPNTGEILAMVGGRDYGRSQFNRAVLAHRQPGSSFKPIVALAALTQQSEDRDQDGREFTLASVLEDRPLSVQTPAGLWEPDNYDRRFRGSVTLREAIEGSLNVPFARLGMAVGPDNIVETAEALGIHNDLNPVFSLALGSSEVTPLELTQAYNVLAAGGYRADLNSVIGVLDDRGRLIGRQQQTGERVFDPAEAYLITSALRGAVERGTGSSLRSLGFRGPVAAKSGTTNNFRDAWFIGYTPSLTVGVWVGFDDGRRMGISGSQAALPIFGQFLVDAQGKQGEHEFAVPYGLEVAEVNRETGLLGGTGCRGETEVFLRGTAPENSCTTQWGSTRRYRATSRSRRSTRIEQLLRELERRGTRGTN
jgi:penicillin-binding protein 1B